MKRGGRPVTYAVDEPVLDRIDMNIVDMPREIDFVANGMLPISCAARSPFTFGRAALGYPLVAWQTALKGGFDQLPRTAKSAASSDNVHAV